MIHRPVVPSNRQRERGQALAFVGAALLTFIAVAVIGVDVGRLAFTAAEVQSIADAAATAAAGAHAAKRADPLADATEVVRKNYVDHRFGDVSATDVVKSITPGVWDFDSHTFTAGAWNDPLTNAAQAVARATVDNLVAAAIGFATSDVERHAIAAAAGSCDGRPLMPIAVGDCFFDTYAQGDPADPNRCSLLPNLVMQGADSDNSCFTSLGSGAASASQATDYLPTSCCKGGNCGGGTPGPLVRIGDDINVMNGQANSVFHIIADCVTDGKAEWDIPLVACNETAPRCANGQAKCVNCTHAMEVTGFAHIKITFVEDQGGNKHIDFSSICKVNPSSSAGCNDNSVTVGLSLVK